MSACKFVCAKRQKISLNQDKDNIIFMPNWTLIIFEWQKANPNLNNSKFTICVYLGRISFFDRWKIFTKLNHNFVTNNTSIIIISVVQF